MSKIHKWKTKFIFAIAIMAVVLCLFRFWSNANKREVVTKILRLSKLPDSAEIIEFEKETFFEYTLTCIIELESKEDMKRLFEGRTWEVYGYDANFPMKNYKSEKLYRWSEHSAFAEIHILKDENSVQFKRVGIIYSAAAQ